MAVKKRSPDAVAGSSVGDSIKKSPWPTRLMKMKKYQERHSKTWARNERLLYGQSESDAESPNSPSSVNTIAYAWGLVQGLMTNIYTQNPDMIAEAYDPAMMDTADTISKIARYDIEQMDVKTIGNLHLIDIFIAGYGATIEVLENEKKWIRYPDEEGGEDAATPAKKKAVSEEEQEGEPNAISDQEYSARRIHYKDVLFDPRGKLLDLSDHQYVAVAFYPTVGELRQDPKFTLPEEIDSLPECTEFSRADQKTVGRGQRAGGRGEALTDETEDDYKTICVWEIHDKIGEEIVYITDSGHYEIARIPMPVKFQIGSRVLFPVTLMAFHASPTAFYPKPEIDLIAPQLTEINELERIMSKDSRTKWRKYAAFASLIGPEQASILTDESSENNLLLIEEDKLDQFMPAGSSDRHQLDIHKLVAHLEDVSLPRDLPGRKQMIEADIFHIIGYGPVQFGGTMQSRSARDAVIQDERLKQRLMKRMDAVGDYYRLFGTKHIQFLQETMEIDRYARIFPKAAELQPFLQYSKDDIVGDFHFTVYAGSSAPKNTESKKMSELQLYQAVAPILVSEGQSTRIPFMRLARANEWDGVDEIFNDHDKKLSMLGQLLFALQSPMVSPEERQQIVPKLLEAASAVVMTLPPEKIQMLKQSVSGQPGAAPGGGSAPPKKAKGPRGDPHPQQALRGV